MNHHYVDIIEKLGRPTWWDEHAVPRYCPFHPAAAANIYAREVVLLQIACQSCGMQFDVCMSTDSMTLVRELPQLSQLVEADAIHYGDPPNAGCCPAGPTMNSVPLRVLEFWDRTLHQGEVRRPDLERKIDSEWSA